MNRLKRLTKVDKERKGGPTVTDHYLIIPQPLCPRYEFQTPSNSKGCN